MSCYMKKNNTNTCQRVYLFKLSSLFNLWNEDSDFEITTYNYFLNLPALNFRKTSDFKDFEENLNI